MEHLKTLFFQGRLVVKMNKASGDSTRAEGLSGKKKKKTRPGTRGTLRVEQRHNPLTTDPSRMLCRSTKHRQSSYHVFDAATVVKEACPWTMMTSQYSFLRIMPVSSE